MTKVKYQLEPPDMPQYIGSPDTTFAGSRNGFSSVILWDHVARHTRDQQIERVSQALDVAAYAEQQLLALGHHLDRDLHVGRSPLAITVRFLQPSAEIIAKYSLSTETYKADDNLKYAHLFVMPGVTTELIDRFVKDLSEPGAFEPPAPPAAVRDAAVSAAEQPASLLPPDAVAVPLVGRGFQ